MKRIFKYFLTAMAMGVILVACGGKNDPVNPDPGPGPDPGPDPDPQPEVITDYYVSVEGSGTKDGKSAENAMCLEDIRAFVMQSVIPAVDGEGNPVLDEGGNPVLVQDDEAAFAMAELLDGTTIHFADGTYVLNAEVEGILVPAKMEFSGYEKQVAVTFEGSENAILSGNNAYRVLTVGNQVNLTIKGMTVKDGNMEAEALSENGAGILVAAGESGDATLNLDGVLFSNNRNKESQSGGAIRVAKGTLNAKDCVFDETNYARNGGSIFTNNAESVVVATGCTFKTGTYNTGGAANNSGGRQTYKDCLFEGCTTKAGTGAAIHANAEGCVLVVEGCTFKKCKPNTNNAGTSSKDSGVISVQLADATVNDCLFEECEGLAGALILVQSANNIFKCNNTAFIGNIGNDRGLIKVNASGGNDQATIAFFNNCVFYNNKMKTNQWGLILHGGNPGVAAFNNCTFYGNTRQQSGGNGVGLNTDGSVLLVNSTFIEADDLVSLRANTNDARNGVLVANSILINTSEGKTFFASDKLKPTKSSSCYSIMGATYSAPEHYVSTNDVNNATLETLNGSFNENSKLYVWNGPANDFTKLAAADFENALKNGANYRPNNTADFVHPYIGTKTVGEAFYDWLVSIEAIGKDAAGTARGNNWWPGAYQAN